MIDRPLTLFGISLRNLMRQRVRTTLTVLSVSIGVVAIVSFSTLIRGVWEGVEDAIKAGSADMLVFQQGAAADIFSTLDEEQTRAKLRADPGVKAVAAAAFHIAPIDDQPFVILYGCRLNEFMFDPNSSKATVVGRRPTAEDEVMLGHIVARSLEKQAGDTLTIAGEEYKVSGVFETSVVFFNGGVLMSLKRLQAMTGRAGQVNAFAVQIRPDADLNDVADRLEAHIPEIVAITNAAEYNKVDQGLEIGSSMVIVVSGLALFIGAIIVMNTMWMTVYERTREIGVLRAIGWPSHRVISLILVEATCVGLLALVVGSILGAALAELTTVLPVASHFNRPVYAPASFMLAFGVVIVLSLLGATLPAWRAARITPAEALRYE